MVILGAVIGVVAAFVAQVAGHALTRRREADAEARRHAAQMLGLGRVIQTHVGNSRTLGSDKAQLVKLIVPTLGPFVQAGYHLAWVAPKNIRPLATAFQDATNDLIHDWDVQREGMLDQEMVDTAQALENAMELEGDRLRDWKPQIPAQR